MSDPELSRRSFVGAAALSGTALLLARTGAVPGAATSEDTATALPPARLLLHNNENPLGPGPAVLDAVRSALGSGAPAGRYPYGVAAGLREAIADRFGAAPEAVLLGCGSTQVLLSAVQLFTSPTRPLVAGAPSYEAPAGYARKIGTPVREVPLDAALRLDLDAMAEAAKGAGLVFLANPNNPTATVWPGDAVDRFLDTVAEVAPEALVLIDEAYHDYVTDPAHRSQAPRALHDPRVLVSRTFSKAHGMAGLRVGYGLGHPETVKRLAGWEGLGFLNVPGVLAGVASIRDTERLAAEAARNTEARRFTTEWFRDRGLASTDSQCNFVFVRIGRPAKAFREACRREGVLVGRDFPPFEDTHARISIGTLEQMEEAVRVFEKALEA